MTDLSNPKDHTTNTDHMNPKSNKTLSNAFFDVASANRNVPTSEAAHGQQPKIVFDWILQFAQFFHFGLVPVQYVGSKYQFNDTSTVMVSV